MRSNLRSICSLLLAWLLVLAAGLSAAQEIRIIHWNDWHGHVQPASDRQPRPLLGGAAQLAWRLAALRQEKPSLVLAAGDMIQGSVWANFRQGRAAMDLLNRLRLDAMVVGNHEFDFGLDVLRQRLQEARFPVLGANVTGVPELQPWIRLEVQGVSVAVIGLLTPETGRISVGGADLRLRFLAPEQTLAHYLPEMRSQAQLIVVLSHLGLAADKQLAAQVPGIDLIVGGHSHTRLAAPVVVGDTLIVQAWEHGKVLGVLDLQVEDGRIRQWQGRLEAVPAEGPGDPEVAQLVAYYEAQMADELGAGVGRTALRLDGTGARQRETDLGNWLADIARQVTGAQVAILNGGGIRGSLPAGPIRRRDIYEVLPFPNRLVVLRLTGRQLRQVLEHSLSSLPRPAGRFLQVSGLVVRYDPGAPPGRRLLAVQVVGRPLADHQHYTVATVDYLAIGGDGYHWLANLPRELPDGIADLTFQEVVIQYLAHQQTVAPPAAGRLLPSPAQPGDVRAPAPELLQGPGPAPDRAPAPRESWLRQPPALKDLVQQRLPDFLLPELGRLQTGDQPPVFQHHQVLSQSPGLVQAVGDHHDLVAVFEGQQERFDILCGAEIQIGRGLVQQEKLRLQGQGAGQAEALLLAP